jgi:hypothetical protein
MTFDSSLNAKIDTLPDGCPGTMILFEQPQISLNSQEGSWRSFSTFSLGTQRFEKNNPLQYHPLARPLS